MKVIIITDTHYGFSKNTKKIHESFFKKLKQTIKENDCKVLIHSGDWGISSPIQVIESMTMIRQELKEIPIITVFGNHDVWDDSENKLSPKEIKEKLEESANKNKIIYLEKEDFILDNVLFTGFDGWYHEDNPKTKDKKYMTTMCEGELSFSYLRNSTLKRFESILEKDLSSYRKTVLVTHMTPYVRTFKDIQYCANPKLLNFIDGTFDLMINGHSHQEMDEIIGSVRIVNSGGDYDSPNFKIIDI